MPYCTFLSHYIFAIPFWLGFPAVTAAAVVIIRHHTPVIYFIPAHELLVAFLEDVIPLWSTVFASTQQNKQMDKKQINA